MKYNYVTKMPFNFLVYFRDGKNVQLRVKPSTQFRKVSRSCREWFGDDKIDFYFDGKCIDSSSTLADIGLAYTML